MFINTRCLQILVVCVLRADAIRKNADRKTFYIPWQLCCVCIYHIFVHNKLCQYVSFSHIMTVKMWQTLKFTALLLEIGAFFCVVLELVFLTFVGALEIYVCIAVGSR